MLKLLNVVLLSACALATAPSIAVTVVECLDPDGDIAFRDACPPGATQQAEVHLTGLGGLKPTSIEKAAAANPITVYTVPDCDACDLVRNALSARGIPFTEKGVQDDAEMQKQLQAITGGLTVPALTVGEQVLTGYSRDAIDNALLGAGYPINEPAASGAEPDASKAPE